MSFGADARVVSPDYVRDELCSRLSGIAALYGREVKI